MLFSVVVVVSVTVRIIFFPLGCGSDLCWTGSGSDSQNGLDLSPVFRYGSEFGCMYFGNQLIIVTLLHNVVRSCLLFLENDIDAPIFQRPK